MRTLQILALALTAIAFNAAAATSYSIPTPAGVMNTGEAKCPSKHSMAFLLSKRDVKNGTISFVVDDAATSDYEPKGAFKAGKPSKRSSIQQAVNEYDGAVPVVLCARGE